jgi:hypothetical protein
MVDAIGFGFLLHILISLVVLIVAPSYIWVCIGTLVVHLILGIALDQ